MPKMNLIGLFLMLLHNGTPYFSVHFLAFLLPYAVFVPQPL